MREILYPTIMSSDEYNIKNEQAGERIVFCMKKIICVLIVVAIICGIGVIGASADDVNRESFDMKQNEEGVDGSSDEIQVAGVKRETEEAVPDHLNVDETTKGLEQEKETENEKEKEFVKFSIYSLKSSNVNDNAEYDEDDFVYFECVAEKDMTWEEWCTSEYNEIGVSFADMCNSEDDLNHIHTGSCYALCIDGETEDGMLYGGYVCYGYDGFESLVIEEFCVYGIYTRFC